MLKQTMELPDAIRRVTKHATRPDERFASSKGNASVKSNLSSTSSGNNNNSRRPHEKKALSSSTSGASGASSLVLSSTSFALSSSRLNASISTSRRDSSASDDFEEGADEEISGNRSGRAGPLVAAIGVKGADTRIVSREAIKAASRSKILHQKKRLASLQSVQHHSELETES
jgi:hypothetical protein